MERLSSFLVLFLSIFIIAGCSFDATFLPAQLGGEAVEPILKAQNRTEPDFIAGETVTTANGVVVKGAFGELSEKKVLANGVEIEGVFYE